MQDAFLVVGLGNPGVKYENTRHNAGFLAVECLCERWGVALKPETKFNALVGRGFCGERQVILCQPQTYMNASGKSVAKLVNYFKIKSRDLMVMVDDDRLPLEPGETPEMKKVRFRTLGCYPLTGAIESSGSWGR